MKNRLTNYWNILTGVKNQSQEVADLKIILFRDKTTSRCKGQSFFILWKSIINSIILKTNNI